MAVDWADAMTRYGARPGDVVPLQVKINADHVAYLDLMGQPASGIPKPAAVVQCQRQPLLYIYSEASLGKGPDQESALKNARHLLAMRGDAAMVAVHRPGRLDLYSTSLRPDEDSNGLEVIEQSDGAQWLVPRLAQGESLLPVSRRHVAQTLFDLLDHAARDLDGVGVTPDDSLSLTGRAMFLRFLLDRGILPRHGSLPFLGRGEQHEAAFADAEHAWATCRWLDTTFNGDLLPLSGGSSQEYFRQLWTSGGTQISNSLSAILALDTAKGGGAYQQHLQWDELHLAHVPVGLLSQVYERHMARFHSTVRKETSAYYTPRHLVESMVDAAFFELNNAHTAKVLDPAAGAGVFLVAAFHKLVEARWKHDGKRPDRGILKKILQNQIRGFDVNRSALRLSALSLYLTRLELDPDPYPTEALKFDALKNEVLFDWSGIPDGENLDRPVPGSLGDLVGPEHDNAYDVVIGNPPWGAHEKGHASLKSLYTKVSRSAAEKRGLADAAEYKNPDGVPDLPFLWRSMEWARPGGRIALALHGRLLFKESKQGIAARNALFSTLKITGILNGAGVSETKVWPNMKHPFCLLFAENSAPEADDAFYFVSPVYEPLLNNDGRMRIDAQAAEPVAHAMVVAKPWLLKALFRGGRLVPDLLEKIEQNTLTTIKEYWNSHGLKFGEGYQVSGTREKAEFLLERLNIEAKYDARPFHVMADSLGRFERKKLHRRRKEEIYRQPLVLVREGFRYDRNRGRALLVEGLDDVAFSESYAGLSCHGHPDAVRLAKYLILLLHSPLAMFWLLMTSSKFGVERNASLSEDVRGIPLVPFESLVEKHLLDIEKLSGKLFASNVAPPWQEIDELIYEIYGLNRSDRQVIEDVLATSLPKGSPSAKLASKPPNARQKEAFRICVEESLMPLFEITGRKVSVTLTQLSRDAPWSFLDIQAIRQGKSNLVEAKTPQAMLDKADDLMASRITQVWESDPGRLRIGLLNQYRYWTVTQARILAADILRNHGYRLEQGSLN